MKKNCLVKSKLKDVILDVSDDVWLRQKINGSDITNASMYLTYRGLRAVEYTGNTLCEVVFCFEV